MIKRLIISFTLLFLIIGCQPNDQATPTTAPSIIATSETIPTVAIIPNNTAIPTKPVTPAPNPTEETEPGTVTADPTTTPPPTSQPTATAIPFNGRHPDGSYYRGAANAPVVIYDYSDFL